MITSSLQAPPGVSIVEGAAATAILKSQRFQSEYSELYHRCPWATANQHPGFLNAWYTTYEGVITPILVIRISDTGALEGLFTLALDERNESLIVAGMPQIDYAAWVCDSTIVDVFSVEIFTALSRRFPNSQLQLRYVAREQPAAWLHSSCKWGGGSVCTTLPCPVLNLHDTESLERTLRKKSNKSRYNRLKRLGTVEIHKISGRAELEKWIADIEVFCDLRQGAVHDSLPFRMDKRKREFHLQLAGAGDLLHTTVMLVGGKLAAALLCFCDRKSAAIALFAISPFFEKHSPGKLLIYETALLLSQQGYRELDLTPGGDWKDRFATDTADSVLQARMYFSRAPLYRDRAKQFVSTQLSRLCNATGVSTDYVRDFTRRLRKVNALSVKRRLRQAAESVWSTRESRIYKMAASAGMQVEVEKGARVNNLEDLLAFKPRESWQSVSAFLGESIAKLSGGSHFYSVVENDVLLHYGWFAVGQSDSYFPEIGTTYRYPLDSVVLFDFYTDSNARGRGLYQRSLKQMIRDAGMVPGAKNIFISVRAENAPSRHVIEKTGFVHVASLYRKVRLGKLSVSVADTLTSDARLRREFA